MESIIRNVRDIDTADRQALEHVVGSVLRENQQLIIQVVSVDLSDSQPQASGNGLPEWCNVYEGLTDAEVDEIEKSIVRSRGSRAFD
jgi:hypothetical protein